ncbi:MAG TPA: acetyl-CoA carboxylase carboxyltransferase subunit alpha [Fimbriimonadaceae bacterium]|nr:acetyl-CoA carboxylase carboxyltransferase subunit alpha [Fimbriimonadaceae bacterium]
MAKNFNEWMQPLSELEEGIKRLEAARDRETDALKKADLTNHIDDFKRRRDNFLDVMYARLGPWEKVLVARAPKRPYTLDYINSIFTNFVELQGDRRFGADHAIIGGCAMLDDQPCVVLGHQKGRTIQERQQRNFGYARPEGYRKAIRLFEMAQRFGLPVVTFVDTPGADAGVEAESRGISEAIAASMLKMFELDVPSVSVIIGEGGSGGAIGIACSSRILMQEHAIYSVIAPEGCAAILWRMPERGAEAARALRLTAQNALDFGLVDEIVEEPKRGSDRQPLEAAESIKESLIRHLGEIAKLPKAKIREERYQKFRQMGVFAEG